jgi:hypothetical protein
VDIQVYVDYDWVEYVDRRIYTNKYVFHLFGGEVSLMRKQQVVFTLSTTGVEYMETTHGGHLAYETMFTCRDNSESYYSSM